MNSYQYEALCRYFLAEKLGITVEDICSIRIPNPRPPNLPEYNHQIDLYWETGNEVTSYLNIANAKWRTSSKVDQPEVMLLQQVKLKVAAHKAVMLTNLDFTAGAEAFAQDEGIALHIVQPNFDYSGLPKRDQSAIQQELQQMAQNFREPIYKHQICYKAVNLEDIQYSLEEQADMTSLPERERFLLSVLNRRLNYLRMVIGFIRDGSYGSEDDIPQFENEIAKTELMIQEIRLNYLRIRTIGVVLSPSRVSGEVMSNEVTFENYDKPVDYNLKRLKGYLSGVSTVVGVQHRLSERFVLLFRENFFDLPFSTL